MFNLLYINCCWMFRSSAHFICFGTLNFCQPDFPFQAQYHSYWGLWVNLSQGRNVNLIHSSFHFSSQSYLLSRAGPRWPWPPVRPVPVGLGSAGTARVYLQAMCVCVCLPGPTAWRGLRSAWPGTPTGAAPGGQKAPFHLVCSAKAWRPWWRRKEDRDRHRKMTILLSWGMLEVLCLLHVNVYCKHKNLSTLHTCRTLRWSAENRCPTSGSLSVVPLVNASFLSFL